MVQNETLSVLSEIGLSKPEIAVYLASLGIGSRPASMIAKRAGLKRGHTYNVLSELAQKGIVQEFVKNEVRHFTCSTPDSLLSLLEHKEQSVVEQKKRLMDVLPQLQQIVNPNIAQPKVKYYQGVGGIREVFEETLRGDHKVIYGVLDVDSSGTLNTELATWVKNYVQRRTSKGIWYHGILKKSPAMDEVLKERKSSKRKSKMFTNPDLPIELFIFGNKVALISTKDELVGLIIENPRIADGVRLIFEAIWENLPDYK